MNKSMSIRMDQENYEFLAEPSKKQKNDLSKAVRELVSRGRLTLAVERYRKGEASLGRAAELAGVPVGQMIHILAEYGVKANLEKEDYLKGLESLRREWQWRYAVRLRQESANPLPFSRISQGIII